MNSTNRHSRARALSKVFEEFVSRNAGDRKAAKSDMDDKIGKAWQLEIVIPDDNSEYIEKSLLDGDTDASPQERDEMYRRAREFARDFVEMPDTDLTYEPDEAEEDVKKKHKKDGSSLSCMLRKMADMLDQE